tara:strand:+ start:422 stop:901 length:480 start_codon:yes stop_codon:yes gene_type:complete
MENKNVGYLVIGISLIFMIVVLLFYSTLKGLSGGANTCVLDGPCPLHQTLNYQFYFSLAIVALLFITGLVIAFMKPEEKIVVKKVKEKKKKLDLQGLDKDEKIVVKLLQDENKAMFQSALMEKLDIGKVKTTRLLDKLEAKQLIERKRRGMNNIVVLRD